MYKLTKIKTRSHSKNDQKVLVIYTGGTLGMAYSHKLNSLVPFDFQQIPENLPEISRLDFELTVLTMDQLIDSADMTPQYWQKMAAIIAKYYEKYDGFVILHGTDTMAYTASALSFMLQNLAKPIVLTGAQLPIGMARTDAKENFITALEIASATHNGKSIINEVCIYFNNTLLRGNRSRKHESQAFDAFISENYPVLAQVGVNIEYNWPYLHPAKANKVLQLKTDLNSDIAVIKLFPGLGKAQLMTTLNTPNLKALVLETYGSGTGPSMTWFIDAIKHAVEGGIIVVSVSQCIGGKVTMGNYATSMALQKAGVIGGADISFEAALTKLMHILAMSLPIHEAKALFLENIAGEMSDTYHN